MYMYLSLLLNQFAMRMYTLQMFTGFYRVIKGFFCNIGRETSVICKAWLAMCDRKLRVAMCGSKLRCAGANPIFWSLRCACVRYIFRLAMCDHNFARFEEKIVLFFGVNHNSVPQKLRILAIKAIFDPKNPFLTDSIDNSIKITSWNYKL